LDLRCARRTGGRSAQVSCAGAGSLLATSGPRYQFDCAGCWWALARWAKACWRWRPPVGHMQKRIFLCGGSGWDVLTVRPQVAGAGEIMRGYAEFSALRCRQ